MTFVARVWPNGEFSISVKRKLRVRPAKKKIVDAVTDGFYNAWIQSGHLEQCEQHFLNARHCLDTLVPGYLDAIVGEVATLGLSDVAKNPKRQNRGTSGLTPYARKMLRNCAWLLNRRCAKYSMAMLTLTLPPMLPDDERRAVNNWSEIMRQFNKWLARRLEAAGACPWIVGCCEVQEERQAEYGGLPLHAHLLFNSRVNRSWVFTPEELQSKWKVIVLRVGQIETAYNWDAACRVETVTRNAESYLAKYISKGVSNPGQMMEEEGFDVPRSWWYAFGGIKEHIKKAVRYLNEDDASFLLWIWRNCDYAMRYRYDVAVEGHRGSIPMAWVGRLNHKGWVMLRAVWFQKAVPPIIDVVSAVV